VGNHLAAAMVHRNNVTTARLPVFSSIFSAEAHAILLALDFIDNNDSGQFVVFSDSLSCLQAINNAKWASPLICDILEKCHFLLLSGKEIHFCWIPSHVGITGNDKADFEARAALQFPVSDCQVPSSDYKQMITLHQTKLWQSQWDQVVFNKLQPIKKTIGETKLPGVSKRRDEIVLHRARIGHTYLIHCYLLKAEDQPQCETCRCALSVHHVLIDCPNMVGSRKKYINVNHNISSLCELFNVVPYFMILNFLREIQLYHRF